MSEITSDTTLGELAVLASQALDAAGILATLSGGAAVSLYSDNEYESSDLDFVSNEALGTIAAAIAPLGFRRKGKARQFVHPDTDWYLEFPPGPVAFGETYVPNDEIPVVETIHGPLRIVTPTQIVMDRLASFAHWNDGQSWDQAVAVASHQSIDWPQLQEWASREGIDTAAIDRLRSQVGAALD